MIKLIKELFPINRSILGPGISESLNILKKYNNKIIIKKINSGTKVFDWIVPNEWICKKAYIEDENGKKILDFKDNNLHLVGYSRKIKTTLKYDDLSKKLHYLKSKPNLIPFVTSYYKKDWGFCIKYNQFKNLDKKINYKVHIDSKFTPGSLKYGEIYIKGKTKKEFIFTTYLCHPSMVNNELAGPAILLNLAKILQLKSNNYSYRILFIPETIGSIAYLSKKLDFLKKNMIYGFVITCIGDNSNFSYIKSKYDDTSINFDLNSFFCSLGIKHKVKNWTEDRSDSRQFNSNNIDLQFATITRSGPGEYFSYHTSGDLLGKVVSKKNLKESLNFLKYLCNTLEKKFFPFSKVSCEPFLQRYNLYSHISKDQSVSSDKRLLRNFLAFCNGKNSIDFISSKINCKKSKTIEVYKLLKRKKLVV